MKILVQPKLQHICRPGMTTMTVTEEEAARRNAEGHSFLPVFAGTFIIDDLALRDAPGGTTIECECGEVWVKDRITWEFNGRSAFFCNNSWHRETWREQRRRIRSERSK